MKKYKTLMSFSFRDYGTNLSVIDDKSPVPLFMGCNNNMDKADALRFLAAYLLQYAHEYDHAKDFCSTEFDKEQREKQLDELRKTMTPMYEKE